MSESITATSPNVNILDQGEKKKSSLLITNKSSSSLEKVVSACTGAVITMTFSKFT